jgi:hypothetical protein
MQRPRRRAAGLDADGRAQGWQGDGDGRGAGIDVFRRQPNGSWKISRFLAYPITSQPAERVQ